MKQTVFPAAYPQFAFAVLVDAGDVSGLDGMVQFFGFQIQPVDSLTGGAYPKLVVVAQQAKDFHVAAGYLVVEVEVVRIFVVQVDFVLLSYIKPVMVVDAVDVI